jgi:hypothetical protein
MRTLAVAAIIAVLAKVFVLVPPQAEAAKTAGINVGLVQAQMKKLPLQKMKHMSFVFSNEQ